MKKSILKESSKPSKLSVRKVMGGLQPIHWVIVIVVILSFFGGTKIPELMRGVGKGMGEFKKGMEEGKKPEEDDAVKKEEDPVAKK